MMCGERRGGGASAHIDDVELKFSLEYHNDECWERKSPVRGTRSLHGRQKKRKGKSGGANTHQHEKDLVRQRAGGGRPGIGIRGDVPRSALEARESPARGFQARVLGPMYS